MKKNYRKKLYNMMEKVLRKSLFYMTDEEQIEWGENPT